MLKISLTPLEDRCARVLAAMHDTDVNTWLCDLVRYQAAQELSNWQEIADKPKTKQPTLTAPANQMMEAATP